MTFRTASICCINYREPLLWVVVLPLSALALILGRAWVHWTLSARLARWPLRIFAVVLTGLSGVFLATIALSSLPLLLSRGEVMYCTHFVRPVLLLPAFSAVLGAVIAIARPRQPSSRTSASHGAG